MKQTKIILDVKRITGLIPDPLHPPARQRFMLKTIHLQDLIVPKVERTVHLLQASLNRIIPKFPTRLATNKVSDKRPAMVTQPWMVVLDHLLIPINQNAPVAMEVVAALKVDLVAPLVTLSGENVNHGRLVISLEHRPVLQECSEDLAGLDSSRTFRPHRSPNIEEIQRPLAIAKQEAASVEPDPVLIIIHHLVPSMHNEIVVRVAIPGELEGHVGEHSVGVHPPKVLNFRVGEKQGADQGELSPKPSHLGIEEGHIVEDLDAMNTAIVDLILDGFQKIVIADGVLAGFGGGSGDEKDARLGSGQEVGAIRVAAKPGSALRVPVRDLRAKRVGIGGVTGRGVVVLLGGTMVGERLGFLNEGAMGESRTGLEGMTEVFEVLVWGAELSGADCASEDEESEEEADKG